MEEKKNMDESLACTTFVILTINRHSTEACLLWCAVAALTLSNDFFIFLH